ncbi:MAG: hypothetical protein QHJ81_06210 [Anaerolineae bacterium]|nr:hypothetical protein [Anaerolineae bacterium]
MSVAEIELIHLKTRVDWLEQAVRELRGESQTVPAVEGEGLSEREWLLAELKRQGLIRDPTPKERALAAEWDALSGEEKQAHIEHMRSLKLEPLLSEMIIQNR